MKEKKALRKLGGKQPKDPLRPKRPVSAYMAFSNGRRKTVKALHPNSSSAEISHMLSQMWKEAPAAVKLPFQNDYDSKMALYRQNIAAWRKLYPKRKAYAVVEQPRIVQQPVSRSIPPCVSPDTTGLLIKLDNLDEKDTLVDKFFDDIDMSFENPVPKMPPFSVTSTVEY